MAPKKDILFIMNDLHSGGAQKALVSLLAELDYSVWQVDLLLFRHQGVFLNQLPAEVTLLDAPDGYAYFDMPLRQAVWDCICKGKWRLLLNRLRAIGILKSGDNAAVKEQKRWRYLAPGLEPMAKKYTAAIGFLEKTPNYFCIDKTQAEKRILWMHTNYSNMGMEAHFDLPYFKKADRLVAVSEQCAADLAGHFPSCADKISVMHNILSPAAVKKQAAAPLEDFPVNENTLLTVGRFSPEKGIDLALESCKLLQEKQIDFRWFFIGDGPMRTALESKVMEYALRERVFFLGEKSNPYPYLREAKIYVQPSRFEGKSIAIDEAKMLHKPIIATRFDTVHAQLSHLENGYITDMKPEAIAAAIMELLSDKALQEKFRMHLMQEKLGTQQEIQQFYELIT